MRLHRQSCPPTWLRRARPALGTLIELRIDPSGAHLPAELLMSSAFAVVDVVQRLMSVHDPASELSYLNAYAHQKPVRVHVWTAWVLRRALRLHALSGGAFDCAIASQKLCDWQLLPDYRTSANRAVLQGSLADIQLLPNDRVYFRQPLYLDFGGIAKGFAVDMVILWLRRCGVRAAVVNAGGDMRVLGQQPEAIWLRDPTHHQLLHWVGELANGACASSGIYYSHTLHGQPHSALVDPNTQSAIEQPHSYSVIAPTAMMADALTKVIAVSQSTQHAALTRLGAVGLLLRGC